MTYMGHYRDVKRNWEECGTKIAHRDPDMRVDVIFDDAAHSITFVRSKVPVTQKLSDPWTIKPEALPENVVEFGPPVGDMWGEYTGAYYVGAKNTVPVGYKTCRNGVQYQFISMARIFSPLKLWIPVGVCVQ